MESELPVSSLDRPELAIYQFLITSKNAGKATILNGNASIAAILSL
jgi:hypothetical protein